MTSLSLTLSVETTATDPVILQALLVALRDSAARSVAEDFTIEDPTDPHDSTFVGHRHDGYEGPFVTAISDGSSDYDIPTRTFV